MPFAMLNKNYAGQVFAASSGDTYLIGIDGSVSVADRDVKDFTSAGFVQTGATNGKLVTDLSLTGDGTQKTPLEVVYPNRVANFLPPSQDMGVIAGATITGGTSMFVGTSGPGFVQSAIETTFVSTGGTLANLYFPAIVTDEQGIQWQLVGSQVWAQDVTTGAPLAVYVYNGGASFKVNTTGEGNSTNLSILAMYAAVQ